MKLSSPFILLLGSTFALFLETNAIPLTPRQKGIVTLSLKRVPMRQDVHPQLLLQHHINRSHKRLARMTGHEEPSAEVLLKRLSSREAHIRRGLTRVGLPAILGKHGSVRAVSERKTDVVGFNPLDLVASDDGSVTPGNPPTDKNSLALDILSDDVGFTTNVQIGTPPRNFSILMDSGSADFWVGAEGCQSSSVKGTDCGNHTFLGNQSSTSFVDTNQPFSVTYGSGQVSGSIIQDDLAIAGLKLPAHTFGIALQESNDFTGLKIDGLMGLAKSTLSNQGTPTPVESLAKAGLIKEALTSYKISRVSDEANDGEITFGSLDKTKFDQNTLVTIANLNADGFWEGAVDSATVNGQDLGFRNRSAILDTGTSLMMVPANDAETIHKAIPGAKSDNQGGFTIPCTTNASLAISFGGQSFAIKSEDLLFKPVNPNDLTGDCVSGISSGDIGGPTVWLTGDVFLKNVYLSTNVNRNTIQLAKSI